MPTRRRVTLVQSFEDEPGAAANTAAVVGLLRRLPRSDVVVFPEMTLHGHRTPGPCRLAAPELLPAGPEHLEAVASAAREAGTCVVYGALTGRPGRLRNMAHVTKDGRTQGYTKTHVHWTEGFAAGSEFPVFATPLGPTGLLVCFDTAFPEPARMLALAGATAIVQVSAVPEDFPIEIMHRRAQAASVYNQVFTFFVNRRGPGYAGGSIVTDPQGRVVASAGPDEATLTVDVDIDDVQRWREREPALGHRRPDLYAPLARVPPA